MFRGKCAINQKGLALLLAIKLFLLLLKAKNQTTSVTNSTNIQLKPLDLVSTMGKLLLWGSRLINKKRTISILTQKINNIHH